MLLSTATIEPPRSRSATTFADIDVVFLSYREPRKEEFWRALKQRLPGARRVDGVTGFLAAFQRCAEVCTTDHFLMVDGDTQLLPAFEPALELPALDDCRVLTWASRNRINGLTYGNGCLKLWPRAALLRMTSSAGFRRTSGYFVDDIEYRRQPGVFSETVPNGTAEQAFIYGLREVFRFCVEGCMEDFPPRPKGRGQRFLLRHICGVGSDVAHGIWANLGGLEAIRVYLEGAAPQRISDHLWLTTHYRQAHARYCADPVTAARCLVDQLNRQTDLGLFWLAPTASIAHKEQM